MNLEKPIFCFHSVCSLESLPPASCWTSEKHFDMFSKHLRVDDEWFIDFIGRANDHYGDFSVTFDDGFIDCAAAAAYSASRYIDTTVFVSFGHLDRQAPFAPLQMMRKSELMFLLNCGVTIGSHGVRHRDWNLLPDFVVERDICDSINLLDEVVVRSGLSVERELRIAPPHGSFCENHVEMCKRAGFSEVYGVDKDFPGVKKRVLACASGYRVDGEEYCWPWGG